MSWEKRSLLVLSLVIGGAVANASADTVDLAFTGVNPGQVESISSTGAGGPFDAGNTGQFTFFATNKTGGASAVIPGPTVGTWCVEISQIVDDNSSNYHTYTVLGPGSFVAPLTNAQGTLLTAFANQFYGLVNNTVTAAAFQMDIWELLFENTIIAPRSLSTGNFEAQGNDSAVQLGNSWLSSFNTSTAGTFQLFQLHNADFQDQIVIIDVPGGGSSPTPLPAALPGSLALMAGIGAYRKLRRKEVA